MYKLQLEDGTIVDNLEMNGNNYIPQSPIDVNVFNDVELNEINVIGSDGNVEELHNCKIVFAEVSGKQSFIILILITTMRCLRYSIAWAMMLLLFLPRHQKTKEKKNSSFTKKEIFKSYAT